MLVLGAGHVAEADGIELTAELKELCKEGQEAGVLDAVGGAQHSAKPGAGRSIQM